MARTALASQAIDQDGLVPTYTAANAAGHSVDPDCILAVKNGGGASITVTLQTPEVRAGLAVADQTITVANDSVPVLIHVPKASQASFARPSGGADPGTMYVDFSAVTSVTVAALDT